MNCSMSFEIRTIENFERQAHRLVKHYPSFRNDYKNLLKELKKNPLAGADLGGGRTTDYGFSVPNGIIFTPSARV